MLSIQSSIGDHGNRYETLGTAPFAQMAALSGVTAVAPCWDRRPVVQGQSAPSEPRRRRCDLYTDFPTITQKDLSSYRPEPKTAGIMRETRLRKGFP